MLYKSLWGYKDLFFEHSSISFSSLTDSDTVFGLTRQFEWDNRWSRHLETSGIVVAGVSVQRDRKLNFSLFPIERKFYSEAAYEKFNYNILVNIQKWLDEQAGKPDTAIVGIEQLIAEWLGNKHLLRYVTFL
ncbi:hypothetical protein [Priestia megaterium]|uniref:hypothetical protein n=1 Tax=Priestia megaterium TaxID=1404 RepID=UPI0023DB6F93|nr:hypothetical protein [Priestia megaterium]MDF2052615.1 hypothetical protein [Priestia megaterium]MDF2058737.1 hypothetical protein [Priestia megaterium]